MMTSIHCNLRLSDVHATADTVGREFKQLTDKFGMECVMGLLAPVVRGLEWLEAYVESYQHLQTRLSELQMENDTVVHEREQRAVLAEENKRLSGVIRELQRENKCLLMEMDELHVKLRDLSAQSNHQLERYTGLESGRIQLTTKPESMKMSLDSPPLSPPPHVPDRVVHLSLNYPSSPPNSKSPTLTPSPPPPPSTLHLTYSDTQPSTQHTHTLPSSLPTRFSSPHMPPLLPSPHNHHHLHRLYRSPSARTHRLLTPVGRSSSVSDVAGVPPVQPSNAQLEDMCERSRVTRRLSQVEGDLETVTRQLTELQRSREKIVDENKQLKTEVEKFQMEISLHKICSPKKKSAKETPRYYKEDVIQILTEKNQLKEELHTLQEELTEVKEALKMANTSRRRESAVNGVSGANGVVNSAPDGKASVTVRSILTESMGLHPSLPPTSSN